MPMTRPAAASSAPTVAATARPSDDARFHRDLGDHGDPGDARDPGTDRLVVGDLVIDRMAGTATLEGRPLPLRRRELELLTYLAERAGQYVSRQELMRKVWNDPILASGNTLHVHLSSLRRKMGERPDDPRYVRTRRNLGICLAPPE